LLTKYFGDHVLGESGRTRGRTITEADLVGFAGFTGDWHALHVNKEYAAQSRFGQRIAHGLLVLSVASGLIDNDAPYAAAFYGLDNVRFRAPTFIGDTLHVTWEVTEMRDHDDDTGIVTYALRVIKQDDVAAVRADMRMLVAKHGGLVP
jgi:3-hydroxybutyryl-CoA dehydratase